MPVTAYTLFGQPANPAPLTVDAANYVMSVQFSVTLSGGQTAQLTGIWFNSPAGAGILPGTIDLWAVTGQSLVHSEVASWSGAAGSGWVKATLATPQSLTSGTKYKGAIFKNDGAVNSFYGSTANYWSTGPGSGGITSGPLSAPNNAGGDGGQDTFNSSNANAYPVTSFNASNYWVDVEVTVTSPAVQQVLQQQQSGRTMLRKRLLYADI